MKQLITSVGQWLRAAPAEDGPDVPEAAWRAGLLAGAGLFLGQALGWPWERGLTGIGGMLLAFLTVSTMAVRWRTLGDYTRPRQAWLLAGCAAVLSVPLAAALNPTLGASSLPDAIEEPLLLLRGMIESVPGLSLAVLFVQGLVSFALLAMALLALLLGSSGGSRTGVMFVAALSGVLLFFFHPSLELVVGLLLLGAYFHSQWESALILPGHVREALDPVQRRFLRVLVREESLPAGEARVLLEDDPARLARLVDFDLVTYDSTERRVRPSGRLAPGSPEQERAERPFSLLQRTVWFVMGALYLVMPDLIPGPIDDIIIMALCTLAGSNWLNAAASARRSGRVA